MSFDAVETSPLTSNSTHHANGIRNSPNWRRPRAIAIAMPTAAHLESLGLALLITAVASALPLVMILRQ